MTNVEFKITVGHQPILDISEYIEKCSALFLSNVKYFVNLYFESIKGKLDAAETMLSSWKYIPM